MTTITFPAAPVATSGSTSAKAAGFTYVSAWLVGLTAFGVGPAADATDAELANWFADHRVTTAAQSLLIHGVAAVALLVVLAALKRTGRTSPAALISGLTAVALSVVQCALDLYRSLVSTGSTTASLVHTIDRIDGLKMLALAAMIAGSLRVFRSTGMVGRRMHVVGMLAVPALVLSGIAYAGHVVGLLVSAELSLLLLLVWVGYTGVAVDRAAR